MTIIKETGAGLASAQTYASVADADAYLAARSYTAWAALSQPAKEAALLDATAYMHSYGWKGQRVGLTQALDWPRIGVVANGFDLPGDCVPAIVVQGCIELALRSSTSPLAGDLDQQVSSESIGPISVTYAPGSKAVKEFRAVNIMLSSLVTGGGNIRVVRA